ncbi:hypothetical protein Pres01_30630 [Metapseudomonas resinovorans]|uniref:hypothetical protein n=1 Tax=Metapseudomonas resinovorans TaxID=53412 RepID=UPI00098504E8|nr:hypothetical protein [Pseudomonas resinovorans]GLZ87012.1 hypothetical protein Pres01_30630 [Pseudomonas resinovorans]
MNTCSNEAVRVTAWAAILGGIFAYLNVGFMVMVTHGDMALTLHGASMLTLSAEARQYFRLSMFADVLGFYLPLLAIGGYLWNRFRSEAGALGDMAVLAITTYVVLGVVGAGLQLAVLNPLAELHAAGGEAAKAAAETAWTTIAVGSQRGLWWCEGPVVLFWGLVVGGHLKRAGWGASILLPLKIVGWCFGLYFVAGFFRELEAFTAALLVVVVLIFPLWMVMFGVQLRRRSVLSPLGA